MPSATSSPPRPPAPLRPGARTAIAVLLALWSTFIAAATLTPDAPEGPSLGAFCIWCGQYGTVDIVANVLLFLPIGGALRLLGMRAGRALGLCLALTVCIELLQHFVVPGRHGGVEDVLCNTLGSATGIHLAPRWRDWLAPPARLAARLTWGASLAGLAILAGGSVLAQPSLPGGVWWTLVAPDLESYDRFSGRVHSVDVDGRPASTGPLGNSAEIRRAWSEGPIRVGATVQAGDSTARIAPIAALFDERGTEILVLGQLGRGIALRLRQRAADAKLRPITLVADGAFRGLGGNADVVRVDAEVSHGTARITYTRDRLRVERRFALTPTLGWAWMIPARTAVAPGAWVLAALCVASLLVPLAYWGRRARRWAEMACAPLVALVGLWGVPALLAVPHAEGRIALTAVVAIVLGWSIGPREPAAGASARVERQSLAGEPSTPPEMLSRRAERQP